MLVKVKLFAVLKEELGEEVELEVPEPVTARGLLERFISSYPQFASARDSLNVAVDHAYSRGDVPITAGQEVAIFPPVSGGQDTASGGQKTAPGGQKTAPGGERIASGGHEVVEEAIDLNAVVNRVASPHAGGIATFLGVVRDNSLGRKVLYLFYEAYPPMAVKELERVEDEVRKRWQIEAIAITHRMGRLEVGEASVAIAVSSAHRREGIEACHFAIDLLKQTVPVWKKEYWEGGEVWLENPQGSTIVRADG